MVHYSIHVSGRVQGVYFRASVREKARELGLAGFVRNEANGSVYIEAEGPTESVQKLITWCRIGPPHAVVEKVDVKEGIVIGFKEFEIKR